MDADVSSASLLEELDRRQDEVLAQLDMLEQRLAQVLAECSPPVLRLPIAAEIRHDAA